LLLSRGFFDLQLKFAERMVVLTGQELPQILLDYSYFYASFLIDREFNPAHPVWQEFLVKLEGKLPPAEVAHNFYLKRQAEIPDGNNYFGCFYYNRLGETNIVNNHFKNRDDSGVLGKARFAVRQQELTEMYRHIRQHEPWVEAVRGKTWMYNREAYRRLYPPEYIATAQPVPSEYRFLATWGQFVEYTGEVRSDMTTKFLQEVAQANTLEEIDQCFPYRILQLDCPIHYFYEYYKI
jgi:hypothetical protein